MYYKKTYFTVLILAFLFFWIPFSISFAVMSGGTYDIFADTFSATDDSAASTGGTYSLRSNGGESGVGNLSGGTYTLRGGFQAMEKSVLSMSFTTSSVGLGILSLVSIASSTVSSTVTTDSVTGYSITLTEDGNLRDGGNTLDDVLDGAVTAGSEEYGLRTIGGGGEWAGVDTAIVNGLEIATSLGVVNNQETGIQFRAAIGGSSLAGSYAHTITATITVNP